MCTPTEPQYHQSAIREQSDDLIVKFPKDSQHDTAAHGRPLVLSGGGEIFINTDNNGGHRVAPYFLPYPGKSYNGLATTTTADAAPIQDWIPTLNWLYVDAQTQQLKYGVQEDIEAHLSGPFDCATQSGRLRLQDQEGFHAVEIQPDIWAIFYDIDDNGLRDKLPSDTRIIKIDIERSMSSTESSTDLSLPQTMVVTNEVNQMEDIFEEESVLSTIEEVDAEHEVHTAITVTCTKLETQEIHVQEEVFVTLPNSGTAGVALPIESRMSTTVFKEEVESETVQHFHSEHGYMGFENCLTPITEESMIESPAPDPEVINKLEEDVLAMLEPHTEDVDSPVASPSTVATDSESSLSVNTTLSSPPSTPPKVSSPVLPSRADLNPPIQTPEPLETKQQERDCRRDSAIAFVHAPIIYPGPSWRTSLPTSQSISYRPSRIVLDQEELSAIDTLSRSMDFGARPLSLSLDAYTDALDANQKESLVKKLVRKISTGNKRVFGSMKSARSRVLGPRRQRVIECECGGIRKS